MDYEQFNLWEKVPGTTNTTPCIRFYKAENPVTDRTVIIFPGSGYRACPSIPAQEGDRLAKLLNEKGISCFVAIYRVVPDYYPLPILDGRRAVRFVRYYADKFGINKNKIAVLGYSAGGHLVTTLSSYRQQIEFERLDDIDKESFVPNVQVLCYPVINICDNNTFGHASSGMSLLNKRYDEMKQALSPDLTATSNTPATFIWHTFEDSAVNVINTLEYAKRLKSVGVPCEIHIFPNGDHGMGVPSGDTLLEKHIAQWTDLLVKYLEYADNTGLMK